MAYNEIEMANFSRLTGFKKSKAWNVFAKYGPSNSLGNQKYFVGIYGADHTNVWRNKGQYLITTEPYQKGFEYNETLERFCEKYGWSLLLSRHPGFWNPPHTKMYFLAPPGIGACLHSVEDQIASAV